MIKKIFVCAVALSVTATLSAANDEYIKKETQAMFFLKDGKYQEGNETNPKIDKKTRPIEMLGKENKQGDGWEGLFRIHGGASAVEKFFNSSDAILIDMEIPKGEGSEAIQNERINFILGRALANGVSKVWISSYSSKFVSFGKQNLVFINKIKGKK